MKVNAPGAPAPIDSLAVATDDLVLTAIARADLLGPEELRWLAHQMRGHVNGTSDANGTSDETGARVFRALADFFAARCAEAVAADGGSSS